MPRPRQPHAKALTAGRDVHDPQRYRGRRQPTDVRHLGDPPEWLVDSPMNRSRTAWLALAGDIPWLDGSHRCLLAIAAQAYGRVIAQQDVPIAMLQLLRQCLGQMGATPADVTRVALPEPEAPDPDAAFFARPN